MSNNLPLNKSLWGGKRALLYNDCHSRVQERKKKSQTEEGEFRCLDKRKLEKCSLAVLTFQSGHIISAHWKSSGGIRFLWKMLIMSKCQQLSGLCTMAAPSPEIRQAGTPAWSWAPCPSVAVGSHILHCPGQSSPFAQLVSFPEL